jgi:hypothetical protein
MMHRLRFGFLIAVILTVATGHLATAQDATPKAGGGGLEGAVNWLTEQQDSSGGFVGFSGEIDPGITVDAALALAAAESAGVDTGDAIPHALDYLASGDVALVYTQIGPGQAAKLALGLVAVGEDPHDFANVDPLSILGFARNPETGIYGMGVNDHAYAMLALAASGEEVPADTIDALASTQAENGGWSFDGSGDEASSDSNTTAMIVQAIAASGLPDSGLTETAIDYLASTIRDDGAAYNTDEASIADSNSTALVAQAVIATGDDPESEDWGSLLTALLRFQNEDGSFFYQEGIEDPNLLSTVQAIPALAGLAFPIPAQAGAASTPVGIVPNDAWRFAA